MKRCSLLFSLICLLTCFGNYVQAQANSGVITLTPKDTLICPDQTITLHGSFSMDAPGADFDDVFGGQIMNIGFPFTFYGNTYTQCVYSANNFISFDLGLAGGYSSWVYSDAKNNNQLNNAIMFPFHDLLPSPGNGRVTYQTFGQAPNRRFVVEVCRMPLFSCTNLLVTDQLILFEGSNIIEMHIAEKPSCPTWNGGTAIEGVRGGPALEHLVPGRDMPNTPWVVTNDGRRFTPNGSGTYIIDSIPYNPQVIIPDVDSSDIVWYEPNNPLPIGTGASVTVTPTEDIHYYIATVTGQNGCLGTQTYTFQDTVWINYGTAYDTVQYEICAGQTYNWFGRDLFKAGNYDTLLQTTMGCDSFLRLQLFVNPLPDVTLKGSLDVQICAGSSTILSLANPESNVEYQWYKDNVPVAGETGPTISVSDAGQYKVEATTIKGCKLTSASFTVLVNPNPVATIEPLPDEIMCAYDTLEISAVAGASYDYRWSPAKPFRLVSGEAEGQRIKGIFVEPSTEVTLTVYNQYGCYDSDTTIVNTKPCCEVFVPNAFSPNNDGVNDYFKPRLQNGQILLTMQVFDRYGKLIYNNTNIEKGWDGRYENGSDASSDVYMFFIKYTCSDGKLYEKKESVSLMR